MTAVCGPLPGASAPVSQGKASRGYSTSFDLNCAPGGGHTVSHSPAFDKSSGTRTPGATPCRPKSPIHLSIPTRSLCDLLSTRCTGRTSGC